MRFAACPYCGSAAEYRLTVGDLNRRVTRDAFDYHRCGSCDLMFLRNVPENLGTHYPQDYYYIPRTLQELAQGAAPERYKLDLVRRFRQHGRLIEIGPATGSFALLAKQAGFEVEAIEMDARCCTFLRTVVGVPAIESTDELASLQSCRSADVIALWHVVEHLRTPWELVRIAAERLNPGGILVIAAPNPDALQFSILRSRWVHIDAPRHVTLPSAAFVARVATAAGLQPALLTTRDRGSLGWNRFGWQQFAMTPFANRYLRRAAAMAGRLLGMSMAPLESREGAGTAYTMILQKPSR